MADLRLKWFSGSGGVRSETKVVCDADDFTCTAVVCQALPNAATPNNYLRISSFAARHRRVFGKGGRRSSWQLGRTDRITISEERRVLEIHPFVPNGYSKTIEITPVGGLR